MERSFFELLSRQYEECWLGPGLLLAVGLDAIKFYGTTRIPSFGTLHLFDRELHHPCHFRLLLDRLLLCPPLLVGDSLVLCHVAVRLD